MGKALFSNGAPQGLTPISIFVGRCESMEQGETCDRLGEAISDAGDVNGDGFDDMLLGAPETPWRAQKENGRVYLIPGGGK
ncbi:MAG: FG-GAP repeat protein [Deltaproteobacteria bacterium]|nr:FG-GAP repeat protein [Deltaproteobacteria bacterium]